MTALYQHIELSRAGLFALARRHGDVVRLRTAVRALDRGVGDLGAEVPLGDMDDRHPSWGWPSGHGPTMLDLLRTTGVDPNAWAQARFSPVTGDVLCVPVDDDLDINGRCLCGCGYEAPVKS